MGSTQEGLYLGSVIGAYIFRGLWLLLDCIMGIESFEWFELDIFGLAKQFFTCLL